MNTLAIIVTGLPASGKSTVGRALANELSSPCLDKDVFLEALFEEEGIGDQAWRRRLSIEADMRFEHEAVKHDKAVLVSHWRPEGRTDTGTPTAWVTEHFASVLEVYCECAPKLAADRFVARKRYAGHLDHERLPTDVHTWMERLTLSYPLGIGPNLRISTAGSPRISEVISELENFLP